MLDKDDYCSLKEPAKRPIFAEMEVLNLGHSFASGIRHVTGMSRCGLTEN